MQGPDEVAGAPSAPSGDTGGAGGPMGAGAPPGAPPPPATPTAAPGGGSPAQAVKPAGLIAVSQKIGGQALSMLNALLQAYHPSDEPYKDIASSISKLSKHFPPAQSPAPAQPRMGTGSGASSVPQPPMMSGGPIGAQAPRGPIPGAGAPA